MQNHKTKIAAFIIILCGLAFCSVGFAQDNIEFIPGEDSGFYYTIQKGDTLWDLSKKFYDSQWDWPGLWEMNDKIKNPHLIYPGRRIQIFLKEKAALPPKIVEVQKVAKPPKAPVKIEPSFSFSEMDRVGFIRQTAEPSLGTVIKEKEGNLMMANNDIIYIKPAGNGSLIPGRTYQIFSTSPVKETINGRTLTGVKHLIKAQVKILEHRVTYATGQISHATRDVNKDDLVMAYYKRESVLNVDETPAPIDAGLICSEDNTVMINDFRIAFINAGRDKVKPGQIYTVKRKNALKDHTLWSPKKKASIELDDLKSGKLIVLHTEDIASTVMILSSKYAIHPDDMVN